MAELLSPSGQLVSVPDADVGAMLASGFSMPPGYAAPPAPAQPDYAAVGAVPDKPFVPQGPPIQYDTGGAPQFKRLGQMAGGGLGPWANHELAASVGAQQQKADEDQAAYEVGLRDWLAGGGTKVDFDSALAASRAEQEKALAGGGGEPGNITLPGVNITGEAGGPSGGGFGMPGRNIPLNLFGGGLYFPPTLAQAKDELTTAYLQGRVDEGTFQRLDKELPDIYHKWEDSLYGQEAGIVRRRAEGERERDQIQRDFAQFEAGQFADEAKKLKQLQIQQANAEAAHRARIAELEKSRDAELNKYKAAVDELRNAKIDPMPLKGSERALAAIAMMFGSQGHFAGNPNLAYDFVQKDIDRRIHAQEVELGNKRTALAGQESVLGQLRLQIGDAYVAREAYRGFLLEQFNTWQKQQAALNGEKSVLANSETLSSMIEQKIEEAERQMQLAASRQALAEEQAKAAMAAAFAQAQQEQAAMDEMSAAGIFVDDWGESDDALYLKNLGGFAPDKETARQISGKAALLKDLEDELVKLDRLQENPNTKVPGSAEHAQAEALAGGIWAKLNVKDMQGAMSEAEIELGKQKAPAYSELGQWNAIARVRETIGIVRNSRRNLSREYAIRPGVPDYVMHPGQQYADPKTGKKRRVKYMFSPSEAIREDAIRRAQELSGR